MTAYQYHCYYCDNKWGGIYRVNDPECRKCGSSGDFYVKTYKVEQGQDVFNYEEDEKIFEAGKARRARNENTAD